MNQRLTLAAEAVKELLTRISGNQITYAWLSDDYKVRGVTQHDLKNLERCGALQKTSYNTRSGHRAYYRTTNHPIWS
jgi:hypothetical protein